MNIEELSKTTDLTTRLAAERTAFAKERTYLSWLRTGLAFVGGGFAITRWVTFQTEAHQVLALIIGEFLICWGIIVFILAQIDYLRSLKRMHLKTGYLNSTVVTTALIITLVCISIVLIAIAYNP